MLWSSGCQDRTPLTTEPHTLGASQLAPLDRAVSGTCGITNHLAMPPQDLHKEAALTKSCIGRLVIASLAWSLKAWLALTQPKAEHWHALLRMKFRSFLRWLVLIPCLLVHAGRGLVCFLGERSPGTPHARRQS